MGFLDRLLGKETTLENKPEAPSEQQVIYTEGDELEIVACISAAVAYLLDNKKYRAIISRREDNRTLTWSFAGRQDIMNSKVLMKM